MGQLYLDGKSKEQVAIERLRLFPGETLFLAFSNGKDSQVIFDLAKKADRPFEAHYQRVGVDPPESVYFGRKYYPDVIVDSPHFSMWEGIVAKGLPRRRARWCCEKLKEQAGAGRIVVTGIRWAESYRRKSTRGMLEQCNQRVAKMYLNPIIDWTTREVWDYLRDNHIKHCELYDQGFKRIGCVLCPMSSAKQAQIEIARWPKLAEAYRRAADKYFDRGTEGVHKFKSKDSFWNWWISKKAMPKETTQIRLFD